MQVVGFCLLPLKHGGLDREAHGERVVVVGVKKSQRIPLYCGGQMHEHDDETKKPPFKQVSKPHLQMTKLHICGQYVAICASLHLLVPKSVKQLAGWSLQFENSQLSPVYAG